MRLAERKEQVEPMLGHEPRRFKTRTEPPRVVQMVRGKPQKGAAPTAAAPAVAAEPAAALQ